MAQLRQDYDQFVQRGAEVIVVGPEGPAQFKKTWEEKGLPYIGLPDPRLTVLRKYGQEVSLFKFGRMPAQVIVDRQGCVRYIHYGKSMQDIPGSAELLDLLDALNREENRASIAE